MNGKTQAGKKCQKNTLALRQGSRKVRLGVNHTPQDRIDQLKIVRNGKTKGANL